MNVHSIAQWDGVSAMKQDGSIDNSPSSTSCMSCSYTQGICHFHPAAGGPQTALCKEYLHVPATHCSGSHVPATHCSSWRVPVIHTVAGHLMVPTNIWQAKTERRHKTLCKGQLRLVTSGRQGWVEPAKAVQRHVHVAYYVMTNLKQNLLLLHI